MKIRATFRLPLKRAIKMTGLLCLVPWSLIASAPSQMQDKSEPPPERRTDTSLFWKDTGDFVDEVSNRSGDLWKELGHHGPAVENAWAGYRIYFDRKAAVDVYSKPGPSIELRKTGWYLPEEMKGQGYGTDHYFVGETIGLGSIRLWREGEVVMLNPVSRRTARVGTEGPVSWIDLVSVGIPWGDETIDVWLWLSAYAGLRHATLEAWVLSADPVQLVTGLNHNPELIFDQPSGALLSWGKHRSLVADSPIDIGAAVVVDPSMIQRTVERADEVLLITKPTRHLKLWLTTANEDEARLNSWSVFQKYVADLTRLTVGMDAGARIEAGPDGEAVSGSFSD